MSARKAAAAVWTGLSISSWNRRKKKYRTGLLIEKPGGGKMIGKRG